MGSQGCAHLRAEKDGGGRISERGGRRWCIGSGRSPCTDGAPVANPRREAAEEVQLEILKLLVALAWLEGRRWQRIRRHPAAALGFTVSVDGW
jgi:hypothetical protein